MKRCIKATVVTFNTLLLIGGLAIAALGVYVRVDKSQIDELIGSSFDLPFNNEQIKNMIGPSLIHTTSYLLMAIGGVVVFVAFFGCCGALTENRCLLMSYSILLIIIFLAQVAGSILGFLFYDNVEYILENSVGKVMIQKYGNDEYQLVTKAVDTMHQEFQCCGFTSPEEWSNATSFNSTYYAVPVSCCQDMNLEDCNDIVDPEFVYDKGCMTALKEWISKNVMYIGAVAVSLAGLQLVGIACAIILWKKTGED